MVLSESEIELIRSNGINNRTVEVLTNQYGNRFIRAARAVEEDRVQHYIFRPSGTSRWIVLGAKREYLVIPNVYCSCRSFYQDVVLSHRLDFCYHLLAQEIAQILGRFTRVHVHDSERKEFLARWRRTD